MRREDIERALGMIDDDIIEEYVSRPIAVTAKRPIRLRIALVAALTAIILILPISIFVMSRNDFGTGGIGEEAPFSETESTGSEDEINPPKNVSAFTVLNVSASKPLADGVVENGTSFTIEVDSEDVTLEDVEKNIVISPAVDYTIEEIGEQKYLFTPCVSLTDNTLYKISTVSNGAIVDSWAFQTPDVLSVTGTYPVNGANSMSINTAVEISLSYTTVTNLDEYVSFEPHIDGSWTQMGKTWRFIPNEPLKADTKYTVTVAPGITAEDQTITEEYSFTFGTFESEAVDKVVLDAELFSEDKINTYRPLDRISMIFTGSKDTELVKKAASKAEIYRFSDADSFIKALSDDSVEKVSFGSYNVECTAGAEYSYKKLTYLMRLDTSLPVGYYKAEICTESGVVIGEWFIQVSELSVYAAESSYELLLWTADESDVKGNVKVSFNGEEFYTDENGILKLDLKDMLPFEDEYIYVYEPKSGLPVLIRADSLETAYPQGCIYTDKSTYRPDDTVNIWGYVPLMCVPETSEGKCEVVIGNSIRIPVTLDENGTFEISYKLSDFEAKSDNVVLSLDGQRIDECSINVANYVNDYYTYDFILPTNCVTPGETFEFDVKVTHISGVPAVNKYVCVKDTHNVNDLYGTTDENGMAHFVISIPSYYDYYTYDSAIISFWIIVFSGDAYENSNVLQIGTQLYIICADRDVSARYTENTVEYTVREVRVPEDGFAENREDLYGDAVDCELTVSVSEVTRTRYIKEYRFDEYTMENVPVYDYKKDVTLLKSFEVQSVDGKYVFDELLEKAPNTQDECHYFSITVTAISDNGISPYAEAVYMYDYSWGGATQINGIFCGFIDSSYSSFNQTRAYRSYKYMLSGDGALYSAVAVGDSIDMTFSECNGEPIEGGVLMAILMQNGIKETVILDPSNPESIVLTKDMIPGVTVEAVYYKDGVFHRVFGFEVYFNADTCDIESQISYDKDEYAPGDEMTVTVTLTDKSGNAAENVSVNLSIVDSSSGNLQDLDMGYNVGWCNYESYTFSSFRDYSILAAESGGWGGGQGGTRSNFAEVPLFSSAVTDENGTARFTFTLPDSVTEYTVTLLGATHDLRTVAERSSFKVGLDFFIQHTPSLEIKTTDDTVITAVAVGEASLPARLTFTVKEAGLTVEKDCITGQAVSADFGKLSAGEYTVRIEAVAEGYRDAIEYPLTVVETAVQIPVDKEIDVYSEEYIIPESNPITFKIHADAYERYMRYFDFLVSNNVRIDARVLENEAKRLRYELRRTPYVDVSYSYSWVYDDTNFMKVSESYEGDPVLTALLIYFASDYSAEYIENHKAFLNSKLLSDFTSAGDAAEKLLVASALGRPVLNDLRYMAGNVSEDDSYTRLILSLGLIFSGDYESAREMYLTSSEDSGDAGFAALRAVAATFVDRENAGDMIDELMAKSPGMMYLRFAPLSYIKNRCDLSAEPLSITLSYGDSKESVTISGLEEKTVALVMDEISAVYFEPHTGGVELFSHYVAGREYLENAEENIKTKLEGDIVVNGRVYLVVDLSAYDEYTGELSVVIPDALAFTSNQNLPDFYYVKERIITNRITVTKTVTKSAAVQNGDEYTSQLRIPLTVKHTGDFVLEETVFTANDGSVGCSAKIIHAE